MKIKIAIVLFVLLTIGTRSFAQMPGADYTPTEAQVKAMMDANTTMLLLIAQAADDFKDARGTVKAEKNGYVYYNVASANPAMAPAVEMIAVKDQRGYYTAVYNGKEAADFSFAVFMMMPHFGKPEGTFTIEPVAAEEGSKDRAFFLVMKGTKVGYYKYYPGDYTGVLSIGMY